MSDKPSTAIWTPDGLVTEKSLERVELRPGLMEWLVQFSAFAESQRIGIHCAKCKADIIGKNGISDHRFTAACNCREWVGLNREYKPPVPSVVN